ncbi:hypothetical protein CA2015_1007 [Cyclobacterium amurskyense]|uniref:Uncharacterized protein n=1 Tax=Cyclobacterium amurskyense TaxID=320787 RepID=A0A0H4P7P8_9BACT|nr:hypothetical protein CA2015_1007 [Cyclobacterium amurskyense]
MGQCVKFLKIGARFSEMGGLLPFLIRKGSNLLILATIKLKRQLDYTLFKSNFGFRNRNKSDFHFFCVSYKECQFREKNRSIHEKRSINI